jgi:23S rRNA (guanine745-N1)-methyltransferase
MIRRSSGGKTLACGLGHSFDVAKDGHVNLMGRGARATGDTAEMLAARRRFLNAGHYADASDVASAFITRALERAVREAAADADASSPSPSPSSAANRPDVELTPRRRRIAANKRRSRAARPAPSPPRPRPLIVDFGCGEGWWLSRVAAAAAAATVETRLAATDASPAAARLAARLLPDGSEVAVADAQSDAQPFADGSVAAALSAFAPRNPREMSRVLAAGGAAVVVSPGDDHLRELRERKDVVGVLDVAGGKRERVVEAFESAGFVSDGEEAVAGEMLLDLNNLRDLVGMGPAAFHRTEESAAALDAFFEEHASAVGEDGTRKVRVTRSFVVQCFRKPEAR